MLRMKMVDFDLAGIAAPRATPSIPLTFSIGDDTQLTVWVSDLKTQVVSGVLTATGTATLPGHDSDTFTAQVRTDDASVDRLVLTLRFGSLQMDPVDFAIDVSHLRDDSGAVRATAGSALLNQLVTDLGP
jgi:uncharacterized protein YfaS (alpha-2-macroglobulin family)